LTIAFSFQLGFFGPDASISSGEMKSSWINYTTQNDHGFNFSFPSSWTVANSTHLDSDIIILIPPNNYHLFGENYIWNREITIKMSLHEYFNKALKILSTTLREFHLIDSNPYVLSDTVWEKILFTHEPDNRIVKVL
jgi:hypothetical protein